ncbi:flagellar hook-length control protein FliK [Limnohabitans radicicola]|uniref:Flagellar hook-length control protein FliK n=1 Tax=Limnohabitans radicicola TaxID=2771427 RepID=A0A927FD54_9BURK|nr:flagellar hook-length control protein FliK [Limnohabitans radicicola]MBD8048916.1 flagellar hook-length control protein FliK [Limnohabitans radicicola]
MALNLSDSLSTTAITTEKSSFSLKTKEIPDGDVVDFGQLLGGIMNPTRLKTLIRTDGTTESADNKDTDAGQKFARASTDGIASDASAAMMAMGLATPTPPPQNLTAVVLSPNMTAITPSQSTPDTDSLVAFAKSQGLDDNVAAWLIDANKGAAVSPVASAKPQGQDDKVAAWLIDANKGAAVSPVASAKPQGQDDKVAAWLPTTNNSTTVGTAAAIPTADATSEPGVVGSPGLASAAAAISLLTSPMQTAAKPLVTSPAMEGAAPPVQLMPMATPTAWLTTRPAAAGKTAHAAPALPQTASDKDTAHASDLDLTLIFGNGKEPVKTMSTAEVSFTPAAWVMAGVAGNAEQASSLLSDATLVRSLASSKQSDDGSAKVEGLSGMTAERSPGKTNDPSTSATTLKATESGLTTAEREELHHAQAEKMGQAIGQRMLSEMEKGHWHLKMMLKPANLGNIEVEMRLRNGELDANFTASQAATRDLLQDGLPKLKDTLTQMGMDVASMNIGGGSSQKNGGDSTPQQAPALTSEAKLAHTEETTTIIQSAQVTPSGQDGLDVLV